MQENVNIRWLVPESWDIYPSRYGKLFVPTSYFGSNRREIVFKLSIPKVEKAIARLAVELTLEGGPSSMLVPVVLVNGNLV